MTSSDRFDYVPVDPLGTLNQYLSNQWNSATDRWLSAVPDPWEALSAMGDFIESEAREAWQELRDTYGHGRMAINQITRVIHTPCEDKWTVIIETALPAAGSAMLLLLTPSPGEILENYLNPNRGGGGGKGGRGSRGQERRQDRNGKRRRGWPGIPDLDQLIADALPGSEAVQGRDVGNGQRWLFQGIDLVDRVLWYFLLLDVTDTFFVEWSSGLMEARFCSNPVSKGASATFDPTVGGVGSGNICDGRWTVDNLIGTELCNKAFTIWPLAGPCTVTWEVTGKQTIPGRSSGITLACDFNTADEGLVTEFITVPIEPDGSETSGVFSITKENVQSFNQRWVIGSGVGVVASTWNHFMFEPEE